MRIDKYHALENDYLVLDFGRVSEPPSPSAIRALCARHTGLGSDGLLLIDSEPPFGVTIYNPDGTRSDMSGNGMRIAARYLVDIEAAPAGSRFTIHTGGRPVHAQVDDDQVTVALGAVAFRSDAIPMSGPPREVLDESLDVGGELLRISAANVGNPHCVVHGTTPTPDVAHRLGPLLERHAHFPARTNVQFMECLDEHAIRIEIWERGAGYTRASGSSSCAAAAVAIRHGWCRSPVEVHMPGGTVTVDISERWEATLTGAVQFVYRAEPAHGLLRTS